MRHLASFHGVSSVCQEEPAPIAFLRTERSDPCFSAPVIPVACLVATQCLPVVITFTFERRSTPPEARYSCDSYASSLGKAPRSIHKVLNSLTVYSFTLVYFSRIYVRMSFQDIALQPPHPVAYWKCPVGDLISVNVMEM